MSQRARNESPQPEATESAHTDQVERQLDRLEGLVARLKVTFQRFFNGDLAFAECQQTQDEIRIALRALRHSKLQRSVDRFRLGTLEAQVNSYSEMFNRRVRLIEEGRHPEQQKRSSSPDRLDVEQGVVVQAAASEGAVAALFQGLQERTGRAPSTDLGTFRTYLEKQVTDIRQKTGCDAVHFRLVTEQGKVKLKAKPVKDVVTR